MVRRGDASVVTTHVLTKDGRDIEVETRETRVPYLTGLLRKVTDVEVNDADQPGLHQPVDLDNDRQRGAVVTSYGTVLFSLPRPGQVSALSGMLRKEHTRMWIRGR